MQAIAVLPQERRVELIEHAKPVIEKPRQVLLRILDVGICGTDKEICRFDYGTPPSDSPFLILGHESLAEVIDTGPEVSQVTPGDLVIPTVRRPCTSSDCRSCQVERQDFCSSGQFIERGIKEAHGFLAEFVVEEEKYLHPIPQHLRDVGVLIEPLTIAEKALRQVWDVQERLPWANPLDREHARRALVLGAGPVGLLGAMVLVETGFTTYVYSREPAGGQKAKIVESIGGHYISAADTEVAGLPKISGEIDLVYEACGASTLAFEVLGLLAANAAFVFTGVPGRKAPIRFDASGLMRNLVLKNQIVFGTVNAGPLAFQAAIADLQRFRDRWPESLAHLITGRFHAERHQEILQGDMPGIKNVISFAMP